MRVEEESKGESGGREGRAKVSAEEESGERWCYVCGSVDPSFVRMTRVSKYEIGQIENILMNGANATAAV